MPRTVASATSVFVVRGVRNDVGGRARAAIAATQLEPEPLNWCAEFGTREFYSVIYGFPGDYERMTNLLPSLQGAAVDQQNLNELPPFIRRQLT